MFRIAAFLVSLSVATTDARAAEAQRTPFGNLDDGTPIEIVTLRNSRGVEARIMTLGATLQSLRTPDRHGSVDEITLGYDDAKSHLRNPQYFGATVGRFANRIAKGRFELEGKAYSLATNDGPNHLHGGKLGLDKRVWSISSVRSGPEAEVTLEYVSPDGEEGYPGRVRIQASYKLDDADKLTIRYSATTDRPTVINLTNHSYFNLAGGRSPRSVLGHRLTLFASQYTPVDATLIPSGLLEPVAGTPFDFRQARIIGERIHQGTDQLRFGRGYDHNWVLDGKVGKMQPAARLEDPVSGRVMEISTTSPGIQFYSGNFLDGTVIGRGGRSYRQSDGLCLEPQLFPNAPNQPNFPTARLDPGQVYANEMVLRFSTTRSK